MRKLIFCDRAPTLAPLNLPSTAQWAQSGVTVAGSSNGISGSSLDGFDSNFGIYCADDDILYIADQNNNRIVLIARNSTTALAVAGGAAYPGMFYFPTDVIVTRTSVYVMDTSNFRVQKWSRDFVNPVTVAGTSGVRGNSTNMKAFSNSYNLFVDKYDNVYVGDYNNHRVMQFPSNSTEGTNGVMVAGLGIQGSNASQLNGPSGVFVSESGILYIADTNNNRIQKWTIGATSGTTVAGTGQAGRGLSQLYYPYTVIVDLNGSMYITDYGNNRIMRWRPGASVGECIAACSGYWGIALSQLSRPTSITFDSRGFLYVNDQGNNRVQQFEILSGTSMQLAK